MKAVILAGGMGTRISEETDHLPKPMVRIGERPILWHIMKLYAHFGIEEFIICLGYKGYAIKEYFANYYHHQSDVTFDLRNHTEVLHTNTTEPWRVTLVDTGLHSMTGGRLKRVAPYLDPGESFCLTYGDGLANVDIGALVQFHQRHGKLATVTAVQPVGRFGLLDIGVGGRVNDIIEKPKGDGAYVNGGFFVLSPKVLDMIGGDDTVWEQGPLPQLAQRGELMSFTHEGFWHPMDTLCDKRYLEGLWHTGAAPWKLWHE